MCQKNNCVSKIVLALIIFGLCPQSALWGQLTTEEVEKMTASDGATGDGFGTVAISGDTIVVGSYLDDDACLEDPDCNSGSAYVFSRHRGGHNNLGQVTKVPVLGLAKGNLFGHSVAINDETLVVVAGSDDGAGNQVGVVYVFERDLGGENHWGQVKKISTSDPVHSDDLRIFTAISENTLAVGVRYADDFCPVDPNCNSGAVYIFGRDHNGLDNWGQVKKLTGDAIGGDYFGNAVAISGDTLIVGAYQDDSDSMAEHSGSAYIFERDHNGPDNWGQVKKLTASDEAAGDLFGVAVAIDGDTAVVAAFFNDDHGADSGSAYVFERNKDGLNNWGEVTPLTASDAAAGDKFGRSVLISGDTVVVGANADDHGDACPLPVDPDCNPGSAYVFARHEGGPDTWGQVMKLTASDASAGDGFGAFMAIDGDTIVVGSLGADGASEDSGSAYILLTSPALRIPSVPIPSNFQVDVPVTFFGYGNDIAATTFSVDFDATCLAFDPTDADHDGIPDAVFFSLPAKFPPSVTYTLFGAVGELNFTVADFAPPLASLPDGNIATITFTPTCIPTGADISASVRFGTVPEASFGGTQGQDVAGHAFSGSVDLLAGSPGDCNGDGDLTAGDISASVLEVFDGDGDIWTEVTWPTFLGSPIGCDANQDFIVNAGDISCEVLLIFEGPGACAQTARRAKSSQAELRVGRAIVPGGGSKVTLSLTFSGEGREISASTFSLDYDESCLAYDEVSFNLPAGMAGNVDFDPSDTDGELGISLLDLALPFATLTDGPVATLTFTTLCESGSSGVDAFVRFGGEPTLSFGNRLGQSVSGAGVDGGVTITSAFFLDGFESGDTSAWSNSP